MQFTYTADQAGYYVEPESTVLAQSSIVEGDEIFPAILSHFRRLYPEVHGPVVYLGWAPARREFPLVEDGERPSGGNLSINSFIKLGTYIASINNPSPGLTHVYLDTPKVGPTPDTL